MDARGLLQLIRSGPESPGIGAAIDGVGDPAVLAELGKLLAAEPEAVRLAAATALGAAGNPEGLTTLAPLLEDDSPIVRLAAVQAVAEHGAVEDMVPALAALIRRDANPRTRLLAVSALFIVRDRSAARAALYAAAEDMDRSVRDLALRTLGR